jgi:hypothetical protein
VATDLTVPRMRPTIRPPGPDVSATCMSRSSKQSSHREKKKQPTTSSENSSPKQSPARPLIATSNCAIKPLAEPIIACERIAAYLYSIHVHAYTACVACGGVRTYQHEVARRAADAGDGVAEQVGVQRHPAARADLALPVDGVRAVAVRLGVVLPDHHRFVLLVPHGGDRASSTPYPLHTSS